MTRRSGHMQQRQLPGGVEYQIPGSNLTKFRGQTHDEGGILLNKDAEVENNEVKGNVNLKGQGLVPYIFSEYINVDGTKGYRQGGTPSIANQAENLAVQGAPQWAFDALAQLQERNAGRSGDRVAIAKRGGPIKYQDLGSKDFMFNYEPGSAGNVDASGLGHFMLDLFGMAPLIGETADLANASWYAKEGNLADAATSTAAAVPGIGMFATGTKWGKNIFKWAKNLGKGSKTAVKGSDDLVAFEKNLKKSIDEFKSGKAGKGGKGGKGGKTPSGGGTPTPPSGKSWGEYLKNVPYRKRAIQTLLIYGGFEVAQEVVETIQDQVLKNEVQKQLEELKTFNATDSVSGSTIPPLVNTMENLPKIDTNQINALPNIGSQEYRDSVSGADSTGVMDFILNSKFINQQGDTIEGLETDIPEINNWKTGGILAPQKFKAGGRIPKMYQTSGPLEYIGDADNPNIPVSDADIKRRQKSINAVYGDNNYTFYSDDEGLTSWLEGDTWMQDWMANQDPAMLNQFGITDEASAYDKLFGAPITVQDWQGNDIVGYQGVLDWQKQAGLHEDALAGEQFWGYNKAAPIISDDTACDCPDGVNKGTLVDGVCTGCPEVENRNTQPCPCDPNLTINDVACDCSEEGDCPDGTEDLGCGCGNPAPVDGECVEGNVEINTGGGTNYTPGRGWRGQGLEWLAPIIGGLAQLKPTKFAESITPQTANVMPMGGSKLQRFSYNDLLEGNRQDSIAIQRQIDNMQGGPGNIVNKMKVLAEQRKNEQKIKAGETRANTEVVNQEAQLNQKAAETNALNFLRANVFNAEQRHAINELQLKAKDARAERIAGMAGDIMKYAAETRLTNAYDGGTGINAANRFFRNNPQYIVNGQVTQEGLNEYERHQQNKFRISNLFKKTGTNNGDETVAFDDRITNRLGYARGPAV